jgi:hypothetical protein
MIARPARVRMRTRKPCLRARRLVLGWKVRFTAAPEIQVASNGGGTTDDDLVGAITALAEVRADAVTCRPVKATAGFAALATGRVARPRGSPRGRV